MNKTPVLSFVFFALGLITASVTFYLLFSGITVEPQNGLVSDICFGSALVFSAASIAFTVDTVVNFLRGQKVA